VGDGALAPLKINPVNEFDQELVRSERTKDFVKGLVGQVKKCQSSRMGWIQKTDHFRRRRYGMEFRNPSYPWPGSSSIVPPLVDKKIDELKPSYINLITSVHPPVSVLGVGPEAAENASNVEMWFEWLIKFGSPRFIEQTILAVDDLLEMGRGVLKSVWHYETSRQKETLKPSTLPQRLRELIVVDVSFREAEAMFQASQGTAKILTKGEFDERRDLIAKIIEREFDLDPEEDRDREAISQILGWFRSGAKKPLTYEHRDTRTNVPGVVAVSPKNLIVPEWTTDIEGAEYIAHQMWFNVHQFKTRAKDAGWDPQATQEILEKKRFTGEKNSSAPFDTERADEARRAGVWYTADQQIEIHEAYTWFSAKEYGMDQKVVVLYSPDAPTSPLKVFSYQRPSGKWPFHTATFELNKARWYSPRGIPEKLDDLEFEIIQQHRAKLNRMTIANAPTFSYRVGQGINPANYKWIPGQFFPRRNADDVTPMVIPSLDISFEREEQILRTWVEDYLGGVDFGLASPESSLNEPRTATEIQAIQGRSRQSLSLRGTLFQRMMGEVWQEMLDLWLMWGDQETFIDVTGGQPIKLTKEQMQGKFELVPTGTIGEQDPQMLAAKAQQRVLLLMQAKQADIMGDEWDIDLGQAVLDWMEHDDPRAAKRILRKRSPQEIQQVVQMRQQMMQQQQQQALQMEYAKSRPAPVPTPGPSPVKRQTAAPAPQGVLPSSIAQLVAAVGGGNGVPQK
jgi:hypothetical protein